MPLPDFAPDQLSDWDSDPKDGRLSEAEFLNLFEQAGEPAFLLAEGAGRASSRIKLFSHLDVNHDGRLTESEFAEARRNLARLDYDDDETISTTELAPFSNPLVQQVIAGRETPLSAAAPFISISAFPSLSDLAALVLRRYAQRKAADGKDELAVDSLRCRLEDLGSASKQAAAFDADKDGSLSLLEMIDFLNNRVPDVELLVQLPSRVSRRPKLRLVSDRIGASKKKPSSRGTSRMALKIGQTGLDVRVQSSRSKSNDNRSFYLLQFRVADENKNNYLEPNEFGRVGLDAPFSSVDADGDGKVVRDELNGYLERDAFVSQSQIVLSVAADTRTLFHVMDVDFDQRLTMREFKEMSSRVRFLDRNQDNAIDASEISQQYRLTFSMGRPRIFRQAMTRQRSRNVPAPQATPNMKAPDWFRKMDRNQDGDLSWREFLGTREIFDRLDQDQDGLVTVAELDRAELAKDDE
jgi:Ca2+-binding EF-hand superfamily protein